MSRDQIPHDCPSNDNRMLPASHDICWTASRKADVVRAVRDRRISFEEARWRYLLSHEEFEGWQESVSSEVDDALELAP